MMVQMMRGKLRHPDMRERAKRNKVMNLNPAVVIPDHEARFLLLGIARGLKVNKIRRLKERIARYERRTKQQEAGNRG